MIRKADLRAYYRSIRLQISSERRESAAQRLFHCLVHHNSSHILSFIPFGTELNLSPLNHHFASQGRLVLPRVHLHQLELYQVKDLERDLLLTASGLMEPNPAICLKISLDRIDLGLIPGLAFDTSRYRLGYGKGYYDRLLAQMPQTHTIGVGFLEQKSATLLPKDPWDIPVTEVLLV